MTIFLTICWLLTGFIGGLTVTYVIDSKITLEDLLMSIIGSILGPIFPLMIFVATKGDTIILFKKKNERD